MHNFSLLELFDSAIYLLSNAFIKCTFNTKINFYIKIIYLYKNYIFNFLKCIYDILNNVHNHF